MIRTFRHAGLEMFFKAGSKAGIQPAHAARLYLQLTALDVTKQSADLAVPSWKLHALKENLAGHWSIKVDGNWHAFRFEGEDAILVDYQDYHGA